MNFIIFVIDGPGNLAKPDEMQEIDRFNEYLQKNGNWVMAAGIAGPDSATVFDNREKRGIRNPGSRFKEIESYSGFWIVEADSRTQAEELAAEGSFACNRKVELRPFL